MAIPTPAPDRTALVTGASSGIGEAIARDLAARGHGVTLVARREDKLAALAEELRGLGVRAEVLAADLGDRAARAALPARVEALGLSVEVLVNNAGLSTMGPVAAADPDAELHMIEVDVAAVVDLCTRFLARDGGATTGCRAQRGVDRSLPAAARPGRLRGEQGVRAVVHPQPRR